MPYKKSKARQEFETKSIQLLALARQISYKNVSLLYDHKNLIFQSTIVLLCSSLEEYLREFVEDLFFNYRSQGARLSEIPSNPRTFSLFARQRAIYEAYIQNKDEVKILEKLDISNLFLYSVIDNNVVFNNNIDPKSIANDKKYPSPKNLRILYNRIGLKGIFSHLNSRGRKDYELLLRSFLDIRETIAHQTSTPLTFTDVQRNFSNINDLLDKLDRSAFQHICKSSGQKYWRL